MSLFATHVHRSGFSLATFAAGLSVLCALALAGPHAIADDGDDDAGNEPAAPVFVSMETSKGTIYLELDAERAPISVDNFVQYVEDEFYDGTIFHRVISNFMIQGGGLTEDMQRKETRDPIENEWDNGLNNERGTIAMARTAEPDSATSQFFINVTDNPALDQPRGGAAYAVFGKVIAGMDVVDAIREVPTTVRDGRRDVPAEPVFIETVRVISAEDAEKAVDAEQGEDDPDDDDGSTSDR